MSTTKEASSMVAQKDTDKTSSSQGRHKIELYLLSGQRPEVTGNAEPHEELANLGEDYKAFKAFENRWGPLLKPSVITEFKQKLSEGQQRALYGGSWSNTGCRFREPPLEG